MKKVLTKILVLSLSLILLFTCTACLSYNESKTNIIPRDKISYTHLKIGNVIDEGKQAVFLYFDSEYSVARLEIEGVLLDKNGGIVFDFNSTMNYDSPTKNPTLAIRVDSNLIKNVQSVSFTKIDAYTTQEIGSGN